MGQVITFPISAPAGDDEGPIDLLTAVDVAIRDLREIVRGCLDDISREQAEECRRMLERAYEAAISAR
jgi:hypothetical protein